MSEMLLMVLRDRHVMVVGERMVGAGSCPEWSHDEFRSRVRSARYES